MDSSEGSSLKRHRLDSWKEIAAHFGRDVRTVRRWEDERGLPVHRLPGKGRGGVFAYADELQRWLHDPSSTSSPRAIEIEPLSELEPAAKPPADATTQAWAGGRSGISKLEVWRRSTAARWSVLILIGLVSGLLTAGVVHGRARTAKAMTQALPGDAVTRDLYLRGRYLLEQRTNSSLTQAAALFTQAIAREPRSAAAFAGLADTYLLIREYGNMPDAEAYPRAYAASLRAVELDNTSVEGHRAFGFVLNFWVWNFPAAEAEFRKAIELDPRDAQTRQWYASSLFSVGRNQDALEQIEFARRLRPESVSILAMRAFFMRAVDPVASKAALEEIIRTQPEFASAHRYLGQLYLDQADTEFLKEYRTYFKMEDKSAEVKVIERAMGALDRYDSQAMFQVLAQGFGELAEVQGSPHAMTAAEFYAHLRNSERTLHFLSLSCSRHESNFQIFPEVAIYGFLKGNPEFEALVKRSRTPLQPGGATAESIAWTF